MWERCHPDFFEASTVQTAQALIGMHLVRVLDGETLVGKIVETEAYLGAIDKAAHTYNGHHTQRNHSMYLQAGHAYVYFTYGMHHCFNVVTESEGIGEAVLIRALEPVQGLDILRKNRANKVPISRLRDRDLCSGPAKLCQAMGIDRSLDGLDLKSSAELFLGDAEEVVSVEMVGCCPRVGIAYAEDWVNKDLRFYLRDSKHISVKAG